MALTQTGYGPGIGSRVEMWHFMASRMMSALKRQTPDALCILAAAFWAARSFRARNDPERASLASNEGKSVQGVGLTAEKEGDNGGFCEEIIAFVANPFRFMKETSEADDRIVLAKAGLDSLIYLHILQALLTLFTVLGALGVLVLLPLNIYSARDPWVSPDSFLLSTANGFSDPSRDLLPHTFFAILTAVGMVAVVYGLRDFLATTCRMGAGGGGGGGGTQPGVPPVQAYTVELQGLRCDPPVTPEQLQPLAAAAAPGQLLATSVALNVADMVDRVEKARVLRKRLARHRQQLDNDKQRPTVQTGPLRWIGLGQQEDAIMVVEKEIAEINKEIEKLRLSPDRTGTGTAFIVFRKRSAAVAFIEKFKDPENARKACGHPTIGQGRDFLCNDKSKWEAQLAAQPADIYWRNLQCSNLYRIVLSVASFAFLVVLLAFVVTPIFFVQMFLAVGDVVTDVTDGGVPANATLEDIDAAKGKMDGVAWHETLQKSQAENEGINGWIVMLLAFLSPFLVLLINGCIMPAIVHFLAKHLGQRYVSSMQRSTFDLLYFFTVLNVLILPALALEGLDQFLSVTHTVALNQLLGQVVIYGSSTSFFVDYIAQSALLGSAYFFVYHTTTPPSILKRKDSDGKEHAAWEFDFPSFYSSLLSVVAIGLVFAATVPLVLPVVVMFLAVRYYTDKWQLQTAHSTQRPDPAPESTASAVLVSILVVAALALGSFASWLFLQGAWRLAILPSLVALCLVVYVAVPYTRHRFVTVSNKWRPTKDDFPATWETEAPPDYAVAYKNPYLMEDADSTAHLRGDGASDLLSGV